MLHHNYYPDANQGHVMPKSTGDNISHLHLQTTNLSLAAIGLFYIYKSNEYIGSVYGEYLVLTVNFEIDYNIIISLN